MKLAKKGMRINTHQKLAESHMTIVEQPMLLHKSYAMLWVGSEGSKAIGHGHRESESIHRRR